MEGRIRRLETRRRPYRAIYHELWRACEAEATEHGMDVHVLWVSLIRMLMDEYGCQTPEDIAALAQDVVAGRAVLRPEHARK